MKLIVAILLFCIAGTAQEIKLQLKWKHQFQFAGYYAALHQGYYKDAGLDVTIKEATFNMNMSDEILNKNADFGVGTSSLVLDFAQNKPLVVLGVIFQHSPLALMSLSDNIKTIHDLSSKKIMIEDGSADIYALLKREKIDIKTAQILEHTFNPDALIEKKVDAMSVYSTDEPFLLEQKNIRHNIFSPREAGIDFYGDNLFTSKEFLEKNPQVVKSFLQASLKGWQYALTHEDEMIELIMEHYNTQNKSSKNYKFEAKHTKELIYPDILEIGYMHRGRWEHIVSVYKELGFLNKNINLESFLYNPQKTFWDEHRNLLLIFLFFALSLLIMSFIISYIYGINKKLKKSEKRHKIIFQNSASAGIVWKKGFIITDWNEQATKLFGWSANEVLGKNLFELLVPKDERDLVKHNTDQIYKDTNLHIFTNKNILKNGTLIICQWHNTLLQKNGDDFEIISLVVDVTKRLEEEEILKLQANNDFLTKLPNRNFFYTALEQFCSLSKRNATPFGLAFIDLDGFKTINDTYGHNAGDLLLKEIAKKFQKAIRNEDVLARIGGDEFGLIFHINELNEPYGEMINRLLKAASTAVKYEQQTLQVSASIGISFYSKENSISSDTFISQADSAMYKAKERGRNRYEVYQEDI